MVQINKKAIYAHKNGQLKDLEEMKKFSLIQNQDIQILLTKRKKEPITKVVHMNHLGRKNSNGSNQSARGHKMAGGGFMKMLNLNFVPKESEFQGWDLKSGSAKGSMRHTRRLASGSYRSNDSQSDQIESLINSDAKNQVRFIITSQLELGSVEIKDTDSDSELSQIKKSRLKRTHVSKEGSQSSSPLDSKSSKARSEEPTVIVEETLPTGRQNLKNKPEGATAQKAYEEEAGVMSPLANQNSIYQVNGQSGKKMRAANPEDTLEHTMSVVDEKFESLNNKIDSLGMAAEDYRGLLLMKLSVNDNKNLSVQNFSQAEANISAKHQTETVIETKDSNQKITRQSQPLIDQDYIKMGHGSIRSIQSNIASNTANPDETMVLLSDAKENIEEKKPKKVKEKMYVCDKTGAHFKFGELGIKLIAAKQARQVMIQDELDQVENGCPPTVNKQWKQTTMYFVNDQFESNQTVNFDPLTRPSIQLPETRAHPSPSLNVSLASSPRLQQDIHNQQESEKVKQFSPVNVNKVIELNVNDLEPHIFKATHRQELIYREWLDKLNYAHKLDYEDQQQINQQRKHYKELETLDQDFDFLQHTDQDPDLQSQYMRIQEPGFTPYLGLVEDKFWLIEADDFQQLSQFYKNEALKATIRHQMIENKINLDSLDDEKSKVQQKKISIQIPTKKQMKAQIQKERNNFNEPIVPSSTVNQRHKTFNIIETNLTQMSTTNNYKKKQQLKQRKNPQQSDIQTADAESQYETVQSKANSPKGKFHIKTFRMPAPQPQVTAAPINILNITSNVSNDPISQDYFTSVSIDKSMESNQKTHSIFQIQNNNFYKTMQTMDQNFDAIRCQSQQQNRRNISQMQKYKKQIQMKQSSIHQDVVPASEVTNIEQLHQQRRLIKSEMQQRIKRPQRARPSIFETKNDLVAHNTQVQNSQNFQQTLQTKTIQTQNHSMMSSQLQSRVISRAKSQQRSHYPPNTKKYSYPSKKSSQDESDYQVDQSQMKVPFMVSRPQTQMKERIIWRGAEEIEREEKASVSTTVRNSPKSKIASRGVTPQNQLSKNVPKLNLGGVFNRKKGSLPVSKPKNMYVNKIDMVSNRSNFFSTRRVTVGPSNTNKVSPKNARNPFRPYYLQFAQNQGKAPLNQQDPIQYFENQLYQQMKQEFQKNELQRKEDNYNLLRPKPEEKIKMVFPSHEEMARKSDKNEQLIEVSGINTNNIFGKPIPPPTQMLLQNQVTMHKFKQNLLGQFHKQNINQRLKKGLTTLIDDGNRGASSQKDSQEKIKRAYLQDTLRKVWALNQSPKTMETMMTFYHETQSNQKSQNLYQQSNIQTKKKNLFQNPRMIGIPQQQTVNYRKNEKIDITNYSSQNDPSPLKAVQSSKQSTILQDQDTARYQELDSPIKSPTSSEGSSSHKVDLGNQTKVNSSKSQSISPGLLSPKMQRISGKKMDLRPHKTPSKEASIDHIIQDLAQFNEYGEILKKQAQDEMKVPSIPMKKYLKTVTSPTNWSQLPAPIPKNYFKKNRGHDPSYSDLKIYQDAEIEEKPNTANVVDMNRALLNHALNLNTAVNNKRQVQKTITTIQETFREVGQESTEKSKLTTNRTFGKVYDKN